MKRIAAVAAIIVTMLAVPAAAMASTGGSGSGSGSGSGHPGQGPYGCQSPYDYQYWYYWNYGYWHHRHHRHHRHQQIFCGFQPSPQYQQYCQDGQSFVFDMASGSNSGYEVSGPTLYSGEQYTYDGNTYTIGTANPDASSFTDTTVNYGPDIVDGTAYLVDSTGYLCSS